MNFRKQDEDRVRKCLEDAMADLVDTAARSVLDRLEARDAGERERGASRQERLRQVTPDVGRFLQTVVLAARPKSIIEIGTSGGYCTSWRAAGARNLGSAVA